MAILRLLAQRMTIRVRLDPLARSPHFLERLLVALAPLFVRQAALPLLPRLLVHSVRLGRTGLANRILQRGTEILSSIQVEGGAVSEGNSQARHWAHWSFQTENADFSSLEKRIRALNKNKHSIDRVRDGITQGQLLWDRILRGDRASWNGLLVSAPPDSYFSSQRVHGLDGLLAALSVFEGTLAVVPHYMLGQIQFGANSTVLSFHTVGREPGLVHVKDADLPPYLVVDSDGFGGWSSMATATLENTIGPVPLPNPEQYCQAFVEEHRLTNSSKFSQPPRQAPEAKDRPTLFVALQVRGDMTQLKAFWSAQKMVFWTCLLALSRRWKVLIKPHPRGAPRFALLLANFFSAHPNISVVDYSVHDLIEGSDAVFTINSGVGSEALMALKPVYTFGLADYSAGVHVIRTVRQFFHKTRQLTLPADRSTIARFAMAYRTKLLVDGNDGAALLRKILQAGNVSLS